MYHGCWGTLLLSSQFQTAAKQFHGLQMSPQVLGGRHKVPCLTRMKETDEKLPHGSLPQDKEVSENDLIGAPCETAYLPMFLQNYRAFAKAQSSLHLSLAYVTYEDSVRLLGHWHRAVPLQKPCVYFLLATHLNSGQIYAKCSKAAGGQWIPCWPVQVCNIQKSESLGCFFKKKDVVRYHICVCWVGWRVRVAICLVGLECNGKGVAQDYNEIWYWKE